MAASKLVDIVSGVLTQRAVNQSSAGAGDAGKVVGLAEDGYLDESMFPGGAVVTTSAGAGDQGKVPVLDNTGRLDSSLMPTGITADTAAILASENLAAGNFVNVYNNAGTANVRKADATTAGKEATGFVLAAFAGASTATVYFEGSNNQRSGLTPGEKYWLSTTAGSVTLTAPSGSGNVVQVLGRATSATSISFEAGDPVTLA